MTKTDQETCLHTHIARWKSETIPLASLTKSFAHPSYVRIIDFAREFKNCEVERALLQELQTAPDHWFSALMAITGEDPVRADDDFDGAVNAWLTWGRKKGII